jgi:hypothetical protein
VVRVDEAVSEKLARYRRVSLARDLYDLQWFATSCVFDESLTRRLWVLKVYRDVVVDGRGTKPIDPHEVLRPRGEPEFRQENIGYLTKPVRLKECSPPSAAATPSSLTLRTMSSAWPSAMSETTERSTRSSRRFAART